LDCFVRVAAAVSDDILTIKEISDYLKVSEKTIYRMVSRGEIPAFKMGTTWRFQKSAIEEWIKNQSRKTA
jgi:excisionase family DNA binding protein